MKEDIILKTKATYSLSLEAIRLLEHLAKQKRRNKSNMLEELIFQEAARELAK